MRVELGERQVRALVDEVNAVLIAQMADPWLMERFGIEPSPGPPLHTVEEMATGRCTVFGLPVAVVESPDYLLVIGGDRT